MIISILSGCSALADHNLQWFKTENEAINDGIEKEEIKKEDLLEKTTVNGETIVLFQKNVENGLAVGAATISKENHQFAWYRSNPYTVIQKNNSPKYHTQVSWNIRAKSGKEFTVYSGTTNTSNIRITTPHGDVTPKIHKEAGIYFYIENAKK